MNKTPLLEFVYNRKKTAATNREAAVELRITFERKQKYMTTGIRLLPEVNCETINEKKGNLVSVKVNNRNILLLFRQNDYLCTHNISLSKYGQRYQSHQSGACRKEENQ